VAVAGIAVLMVQEYRAAPATGAGDVLAGVGFALAGILCASSANVIQATPAGRQQALIR
jgi:hypothetical protein